MNREISYISDLNGNVNIVVGQFNQSYRVKKDNLSYSLLGSESILSEIPMIHEEIFDFHP